MLPSTRRTFLKAGSIAACGVSALLASEHSRRKDAERLKYILVWLRGGLSPLDSFDPKPRASSDICGETVSIKTSIPGVSFSEYFPRLAQLAPQFCLIRGLRPDNNRHGVAEASLLSGTLAETVESVPPASFGAQLTASYGPINGVWPYFQIGDDLDSRYGGGGTGALPILTGPLTLFTRQRYSTTGQNNFLFPGGLDFRRMLAACGPRPSLARFDQAWRVLQDRLQQLHPGSLSTDSVATDELIAAAHRWHVSPSARRVLDLTPEKASLRANYGGTELGDDCLLARRLVEAGARCVTVTSGGWDHHAGISAEMRTRGPQLDAALAGLVEDLNQRGLLASTVVACLSDFGRTPQLNASGGRDHWPHTGVCVLAGANIPGGSILGRTDPCGERVIDNACTAADVGRFIINGFLPSNILCS